MLVQLGPVDRGLAILLEQLVALGEVLAAQEASVGRQGRRVNGLEQVVLLGVDDGHGLDLLRLLPGNVDASRKRRQPLDLPDCSR